MDVFLSVLSMKYIWWQYGIFWLLTYEIHLIIIREVYFAIKKNVADKNTWLKYGGKLWSESTTILCFNSICRPPYQWRSHHSLSWYLVFVFLMNSVRYWCCADRGTPGNPLPLRPFKLTPHTAHSTWQLCCAVSTWSQPRETEAWCTANHRSTWRSSIYLLPPAAG